MSDVLYHSRRLMLTGLLAAGLPVWCAAADGGAVADPVNTEPTVSDQTETAEKADQQPWIGVTVQVIDATLASQLQLDQGHGLQVLSVVDGSPGAEMGVKEHDILLKFDDQLLAHPSQLRMLLNRHGVDEKVDLEVLSGGKRQTLVVKPELHAVVPDDPQSAYMAKLREQIQQAFGDRGKNSTVILPRMNWGQRGSGLHGLSSTMRFSNGTHNMSVEGSGADKKVKVTDAAGTVVYEGPADTEEAKQKIPASLQHMLKQTSCLKVETGIRGDDEF